VRGGKRPAKKCSCHWYNRVLTGARCACGIGRDLLLRALSLLVTVEVVAAMYVGALIFLPPQNARFDGTAQAVTLEAVEGVDDVEGWAHEKIPGLREIDLGPMDGRLSEQLVFIVADIANDLGLTVQYILPTPSWVGLTGVEPPPSTFFATPLGIGYDPGDWGRARSFELRVIDYLPGTGEGSAVFAGAVAHEMAHIATFSASLWNVRQAEKVVERYRSELGEQEIIRELGGYAWAGDPSNPRWAWMETFAEAFAGYYLNPDGLRPETREMVEEVLAQLDLEPAG
jgi:hypothetical protein